MDKYRIVRCCLSSLNGAYFVWITSPISSAHKSKREDRTKMRSWEREALLMRFGYVISWSQVKDSTLRSNLPSLPKYRAVDHIKWARRLIGRVTRARSLDHFVWTHSFFFTPCNISCQLKRTSRLIGCRVRITEKIFIDPPNVEIDHEIIHLKI